MPKHLLEKESQLTDWASLQTLAETRALPEVILGGLGLLVFYRIMTQNLLLAIYTIFLLLSMFAPCVPTTGRVLWHSGDKVDAEKLAKISAGVALDLPSDKGYVAYREARDDAKHGRLDQAQRDFKKATSLNPVCSYVGERGLSIRGIL